MTKSAKKLGGKIIRESSRHQQLMHIQPVIQPPFQPALNMHMPFQPQNKGFPRWPQPHPVSSAAQMGPCFNCNQLGHLAKNCHLPLRQRGPQGPRRPGPKRFGKNKH